MLWLQAVHFKNPLEVMQRSREEEIENVPFGNLIKAPKTLWFLDSSWPEEGPLNEIEAASIGSDIFLVTDDKTCLAKLFETENSKNILSKDAYPLPKKARRFLPEEDIVAFSNNKGGHVWIKVGRQEFLGKSICIS